MKLKHWIRTVIFCLLAFVIVLGLSRFMSVVEDRENIRQYGFYKEEENSMDVAFIGTSSFYSGFYAPLAYEKYGFTSYPETAAGLRGSVVRSVVREIETYQNPSLYVIDLWSYTYADQYDEAYLRRWIDRLPDSDNKTDTIEELVPEELKESFYKPFLKYHANWSNIKTVKYGINVLRDEHFIDKKGYSISKGFSTKSSVYKGSTKNTSYRIPDGGMEELRKTLAYLNEQGIENVLFLRAPEYNNIKETDSLIAAVEMIERAGYDYLDMASILKDIGIVKTTDFYDDGHLNIYGAEKFTDYVGNYIMENYDISTEHSETVTAEWEDCASYNEKYIAFMKEETDKHTGRLIYLQFEIENVAGK